MKRETLIGWRLALAIAFVLICSMPGTAEVDLSGTWEFGSGGETWTFSSLGNNRYNAVESGYGNARGTAKVSGRSFRLDFTYPGGSGYFAGTIAADGMTIQTVRHFDGTAFTFRRLRKSGDADAQSLGTPKPAPGSDMSGKWRFGPKGEYWTLTRMPDGRYRAQEHGFGGASGTATFTGRDFRLDFTFSGGSGYFVGVVAADGRSIKTVRHHDMVDFTFEYLGPSGETPGADGSRKPQAPGTGRFSVQAMYGGRDIIPLCIVPPRQYTDGTAIPRGTPCEIVVLESKQAGLPGTYSGIVGRGQGVVTSPDDIEPWINLSARVPAGNADHGTIYLACYAVIGGVKSDPTNRFLTISWYPGGFTAEEYPPTGPSESDSETSPGAEETARNYPDWVRDARSGWVLTSSFSSPLGRPAEDFRFSTDPALERQCIMLHSGTLAMRVGEIRTFAMGDPVETVDTEKMERSPFNEKVISSGEIGIFVSPPSVLSRQGMTVIAKGEGVGQVWMRRSLELERPDGSVVPGVQKNFHVVLVGSGAQAEYTAPPGQRGKIAGPPGPPLARIVLHGRAVRSGSLQPVAGARITLVGWNTKKAYTRDEWITGTDGSFMIEARQMLPAGRYEVLLQRFSVGGLGPERDLWTVKQYPVEIKEGRTLVDCGDKLEMNELQYIPFRNR